MIGDTYKKGSDIICFEENYVKVLLSYLPSEAGGSILNSIIFSYEDIYNLSNDEIIKMAWDEHNKVWEMFEAELNKQYYNEDWF